MKLIKSFLSVFVLFFSVIPFLNGMAEPRFPLHDFAADTRVENRPYILGSFYSENIHHVNSQISRTFNTPLHVTAIYNNLFFAKLLLKHGADFELINVNGETALEIAIKNSNWDFARFLLTKYEEKRGLFFAPNLDIEFFFALQNEADDEIIDRLWSFYLDVDVICNESRKTAFDIVLDNFDYVLLCRFLNEREIPALLLTNNFESILNVLHTIVRTDGYEVLLDAFLGQENINWIVLKKVAQELFEGNQLNERVFRDILDAADARIPVGTPPWAPEKEDRTIKRTPGV